MKMLYILNVAKRVNNFSYSSMIAAIKCGFDFHIAGNWSYDSAEELLGDEKKYKIHIHQIDFERKPYNLKNYNAYKQLLILCKKEKFDIIHCNTPIGGILGRIVGLKSGVKTIIYQAHGFHFYKGAPLINWLLYYPIEKMLARRTDILIAINNEDYILANKKMHLKKGGYIAYIPGIGINIKKFDNIVVDKDNKFKELNLPKNSKVILSVGELNKNKNHQIVIKAISKLQDPSIHYLIAGIGNQHNELEKLAKKLNVNLHLLGFRNDVFELYKISNLYIHPSLREGLPSALMEAIASKINAVCSNIRGCNDLVCDGLFDAANVNSVEKVLRDFLYDKKSNIRDNYIRLHEYDLTHVVEATQLIYDKAKERIDIL